MTIEKPSFYLAMQNPKGSIYSGQIVYPIDFDTLCLIPYGSIGVDPDGSIRFVEELSAEECIVKHAEKLVGSGVPEEIDVFELTESQFFFPGFIDTHVHASQYPNVGIFGTSTLLDWLQKYTFPLESKYADIHHANNAYSKVVARTLEYGTTMASYYGTSHVDGTVELAKICDRLGQRALVGRVCMERFCPDNLADKDPLKKEAEFVAKIEKLNSTLVKPIVTPRFAASCTAETLKKEAEFARDHDLPIQTHLSENDREIKWMKELFPESTNYTDIYDSAGLLKHDTILAHCIHLTPEERKILLDRGCGISFCPLSNASLSSGVAPIKDLVKEGQKASFGTDMSGGYSPSVLENARQAMLKSRILAYYEKNDDVKLSVANVLYLATLGGAVVCNRGHDLGNFQVGKKWDALVVDLGVDSSPVELMDWNLPKDKTERLEQLVTKWLYLGDDRNITNVWVNGEAVLEKISKSNAA